ncbi:MAG: hypothetical protein R6V35_03690 [Candidatus Nanohaloarchaea archaeon]
MKEAAGQVVFLMLALFLAIGIAFELFYPGNCTALEYLSREIINLDGTVCSVETVFSTAD